MCLTRPVQAMNLPCAHMFLCIDCSKCFREASGDICVSCRSPSEIVKAVLSHTCIMCMDIAEGKDLFSVRGCGHSFCKACLVQYIHLALSDIAAQFPLRCPMHADNCKSLIDHASLAGLIGFRYSHDSGAKSGALSGGDSTKAKTVSSVGSGLTVVSYTQADHDHVVRVALEALIPIEERVYCSNGLCSRALRKAKVDKLECGFCHSYLCGRCWSSDHRGLSCEQAKEQWAGNDEVTRQYIKRTSKPCPSCGLAISHYRGHACHHIRPGSGCPNCGYHFCFACLRRHKDPECKCERFCDSNCDCQDCPDCSEGNPCPHCDNDGRCRVCSKPSELSGIIYG